MEDRLAGRNDSWGILWLYAVSRSVGKVVYPLKTLVANEGFDGSDVHCESSTSLAQHNSSRATPLLRPILSFPRQLRHDPVDLNLLENVLRSQNGLTARIGFKMRHLFQRMRHEVHNALG
jgi:hypothetical protein